MSIYMLIEACKNRHLAEVVEANMSWFDQSLDKASALALEDCQMAGLYSMWVIQRACKSHLLAEATHAEGQPKDFTRKGCKSIMH